MRHQMRSLLVGLAFFVVGALRVRAQDSLALARRADSAFSQWTTSTPGCAIGVSRGGKVVIAKAYGMANLEYGVALGAESVLESGSVAKQFTAAAVTLLQLDGKLSLDDDVRKFLPEVPTFGGQRITIRNLLTHTSGLRDQWGLLSLMGNPPTTQVHTLPLILYLVSRQQDLNFAPGTEYLYSNTGYALAALIVQRVSGMSLAKFAEDRLFKPLGMTRTQWRDDYQRVVHNRATAYERRPDGSYAQFMPFTNVYGNGGLLTTVGDVLLWNNALTTATIPGGKALVQALETPMRLTSGQTISYALGLVHNTWQGHREINHSGSTAGYQTFLTRFVDDDLSIAVFCNTTDGGPTNAAYRVAGLFLKPTTVTTAVAANTEAAAPWLGRYRDKATDNVFEVVAIGDKMNIRMPGGASPAAPTGTNAYRTTNGFTFAFSGEKGSRQAKVSDDDGMATFVELEPFDTSAVKPAEYLGTYASPELDVRYEVSQDRGALVIGFPPNTPERLTPIYRDGFSGRGRTVRFVRDAKGRVIELRIFAGRVRNVRFVKLGAP